MKKQLNKKGFTLIEVVLVLAIGGLIFLLAFLAFQQVSRNRRDTQRRSDAGRLVAELQNYASDHNGAFPALSTAVSGAQVCVGGDDPAAGSFQAFIRSYMCNNGQFQSPSGDPYQLIAPNIGLGMNTAGLEASDNAILYAPGVKCDGTNWALSPGTVVVGISLEAGYACRDSQ